MSFWSGLKRVGTGIATGGLSEAYRYGKHLGDDSQSTIDQRQNLQNQGGMASFFADQGQQNYGAMTAESQATRDRLRQLAEGKDSLSAEQLRQGLQQNLATQRSMAASASPQNAAMAARTAAMNMNRANYGMSGQAAMAGIAERNAAVNALGQMQSQARQQDLQAALGSRQNATTAYGGVTPEQSMLEKWSGPVASGFAAGAKLSDRRLKEDIDDGDKDANKAIEGLRAYNYKYRDQKHGKGKQLGIMAQDLSKAGLGHTVIETPIGKAVHGASLATANTAMIAALGKRVRELEGKKK